MNYVRRSQIATIALLCVSVVALSGFGCRSSNAPKDKLSGSLVVWGLWQDSDTMAPLLKAFEDKYGVKVTYKKIASVTSYQQDLLKALAEGRGPDVFAIHHTWVDNNQRILSPAPNTIVDEKAVRDEFVDIVAQDVVRNGQVFALPTSVDTLAMYYNKDLLNAAAIPQPPNTWTQFQDVVQRVTNVNRLGSIQQSAAALGTATNINRACDILELLMMQSGLSIYDTQKQAVDINNDVGKRALTFYSDFANKAKKVYTWNAEQNYSIDAFAQGQTAIMFNYSYQIPVIRAKNPRLNFGVAPMPQIDGSADNQKVNFAAYWPYSVSASSQAPQTAWTFVRYISNKENSTTINNVQHVSPARRDSVLELQRDPELGVFTEQTLTARNWMRLDNVAIDTIFNTAIDSVASGASTVDDAIKRAEDQLNNLQTTSDAAQ